MNAKNRGMSRVCGPESDANNKQYGLITEQMENTSTFGLYVFRRWEQSCGKTNEVKWKRVFYYSSMLS